MLFSVWKDARVWVPWNHSFDMYLSCLGPVSQRSHPVSSVHPWRGEVAAVADVPCGHPLSILSSLGVHRRGDCNVKAWWAATSLVYWYDRWHFSSTVFHFINQKTEKINTFIFWPQTVSLSAPLLLGVTWCFCNGAAGFRPRPGIKASVLTCLPGLSSMSLSEHSPWEQIRASCKAGGMSDIWK